MKGFGRRPIATVEARQAGAGVRKPPKGGNRGEEEGSRGRDLMGTDLHGSRDGGTPGSVPEAAGAEVIALIGRTMASLFDRADARPERE